MKKIISFLLSVVLILSLVPVLPVTQAEAANTANRDFVTLKKEKSTIAPGVEQEIGTVRKKYNQQQLVYYMMTIDTDNEYAQIHVNYKDNDWEAYKSGHYGLQAVKDQMDAAQAKHSDPADAENYIENFTIVGGINGTGYNMSTGNSNDYTLMMEGHQLNVAANANQGFFGVRKSGKAFIGWSVAEYEQAKKDADPIVEALGQFSGVLIKNGIIQENCDWAGAGAVPDCNARTAVGVTEDGDAVFLVVDGKQAPFSEGCDMYELALILKKAGCYNAFNWDGGGSTTYVSRPEGEATYRVVSRPCDGSPRNVATSIYVATTVPDNKEFKRASIDADVDYITPGGTVKLTATGITAAGTPVEIPEGVEWVCDEGMGTFTVSGNTATFVANSSQDEADKSVTISMKQNGESVGEVTIHVVKPNVFNFTQASYMVPYGATMPFEVTAAYSEGENEHPVTLHGDFTFALDQEGLGELDGNIFTAHALNAPGAVDEGQVTATLTCNQKQVTASIKLGRGSETVIGFEDSEQANLFIAGYSPSYGARNGIYTAEIATVEDGGHVHSGKQALRLTVDLSNMTVDATNGAGGAAIARLTFVGDDIVLKGATGFGMWVWIPDEENYFSINPMFGLTDSFDQHELDSTPYKKVGMNYDEGHWEWICFDSSEFSKTDDNEWPFTIEDTDRISFTLNTSSDPLIYDNLSNKYVFYIDDFMVDYSPVTPDREEPTIKNVKTHLAADVYDELVRGTTYTFASNVVSFDAEAVEDDGFNATGIDPDSAHAFIDGCEVNATFFNGQIVVDPVTVADGVHTLKLYLSDNEGNTTNQTRRFKVDSNSGIPTVNVVLHETNSERVLAGAVTYVDVNATDISKIKEVTMTLDLINSAQWEIKHADVNPKFEMSEPIIDPYENIATVTFTRRTDWREGDSNTIASIPIRAWGFDYSKIGISNETIWSGGNFSPHNIELDVDVGKITYVDGYTTEAIPAFGMEHLRVETQIFDKPAIVKEAYPGSTWHLHDTELESVPDKGATCTERGISGRKICKTCGSPVSEEDWGTVIDVKAHDYQLNDNGELACTMCKELFNGVKEGKTYVNGKVVVGWQDDGTYYEDGIKFGSGLHQTKDTVDGKEVTRWHLFDENGVCDKDNREDAYTGYYTKDGETLTPVKDLPANVDLETNEYYYLEGGLPRPGWLFFRKDGTTVDPDQSTETVPSEDEDSGETGSEGTTSETKPGVEPGMPDPDQQQAIMDIVAYHVHSDGRVHSVEYKDTRTCVVSGYMEYTCKGCGEKEQSERLWWVGHDWDENHVCKREDCKFVGKDISEASLNIMGKHFEYSGGEIRSAVYVYHDGKQLSVRSDKNGHDGYVWFENNKEIGVATVHIRGEGDYYGELVGTFEIVPQSVTTVDMTQTAASDADHVKVTLSWSRPLGAEFYDVWRYDYVKGDWIRVGKEVTDTTFSEELEVGTDYDYRVASRARDAAGNIYYSVRWSDSVNGTIRHSWGAETDKVDATCTTEGQYKHTCTLCGFTETVTVPATGHKVETWEITEQATTSAPGERKGTCTVCGETVTEEIPQLPPVITGTGNTTSPDAKQETVTNEDGSTTTTTTKPDGSKTETTTQTDGTVTEKNTEKSGVVTETTTKPDNTVTEKVTQTDGSATEKTTTPEGVVGQKNTDADGKVTSAEVVIPKEAEKQDVVTAPVEVPAAKSAAEAPEISVRTESSESKKVEIPVTEFGPGTVAVVVHEDGTEEVVRDCVMGENGVVLNVEGDVTLKIVDNTETFEDVEEANHWATDAVEFVAARELFNGTGENKFTPNGAMTRGMMVTVLYRLAYEPDTVAEQFADVPSGQYYSDAVAWAQNAGVVTGYDDNTFAPDDNVKREQLVTILYRYAKKMGYATTASGTLAGFADASSVSSWAADAMSWAIDIGLVNGVDATHLAPANNATRAEVATILMRFCEKVVK